MKNIIFIAPPAAGKGTISEYLIGNHNYEYLSTGDMLREEIKSGSELGKNIEKIIADGNLVNDELIIELVSSKLNSLDKNKPFILDGFPRTLVQASKLDEMLVSLGVTNNVAIYLDIDMETATKRATGRITCPKCKKIYHQYNPEMLPKVENMCDICNVELEKRSDDNEETFKVRFQNYLENTSPLLDYYKEKQMLLEVNAVLPLSEIFEIVVNEAKND